MMAPKGKQVAEEKWADDPGPPDRDGPMGPGPAGGGPRRGPPRPDDRNGPPDRGQPGMGPPGGPRQGPPDAEDREGPPPGGPGMGPDGPGVVTGGPGMGGGVVTIRRGEGPGMDRPGNMIYFRGDSLEKNDPEMFKLFKADMDLEHQTRHLAMQYRRASSDDRPKLKAQLKDLIAKHFDVRQERRALELKRLEAELGRLREAMERRLKAREKLVEQRVSDLVGREEEPTF